MSLRSARATRGAPAGGIRAPGFTGMWLNTTGDVRVPLWGVALTTPEVSADQAAVKVAVKVEKSQPALSGVSRRLRPAGHVRDGRSVRSMGEAEESAGLSSLLRGVVAAGSGRDGPAGSQPSERHRMEHRQRDSGTGGAAGRGTGRAACGADPTNRYHPSRCRSHQRHPVQPEW
jgi:hypothetical protein